MSRKWHKPNTSSHRIKRYIILMSNFQLQLLRNIYICDTSQFHLSVNLRFTTSQYFLFWNYICLCQLQFLPFWFGLTEHWNTRNRPLTPCRQKTVDFTCICFIIMPFSCSCLNRYIYSTDYKIITQEIACLFHS